MELHSQARSLLKGTGGGVKQAFTRSHRWAMAVGASLLAGACDHAVVLNPKGPIADAERGLLIDAFSAALIVIAVGVLVWRSTHKLDPYREIASDVPPLDIQVVAQDWKWLFIYPEQGVAVVNQMAIPSGRPISLRITSDTVMNSFYVPALAGQIYAMAGMQTRLQMLANAPGRFVGRNTQYSGGGFSDQFFEVLATSPAEFDAWVAKTRQAPDKLDAAAYAKLAEKSRLVPIAYYSAVEPQLFDSIIAKYTHGHHVQAGGPPPAAPDRR